jgi:hypothetical protein
MSLVLCEVGPGLREEEASVAVRDVNGRAQRLRVDKDFVVTRDHEQYLPIGVVATHPDAAKKAVLIELPHEADSGVNRLWVPADHLLRDAAK